MKATNKTMFNSGRGPQTGNAGNMEKRKTFMEEKSKSGSEKSELADMITNALETRGRLTKPTINKGVEGLHMDTNVGSGPTKGNAGKRNSSNGKPSRQRGALGATLGY